MALYMEGVSSSSGSTGESFSTVVSRFTCHTNIIKGIVSRECFVRLWFSTVVSSFTCHTTQVTILKGSVSRECFNFADCFKHLAALFFVRNT